MGASINLACGSGPTASGVGYAVHKAFFFSALILLGPFVPACRLPFRRTSSDQLAPPAPRPALRPAPGPADNAAAPEQDQGVELSPVQGNPWLVGVSPSLLPNFGLSATVAREVGIWHGGGLALETEFTDQFLDDKAFTKSTDPAAGDWTQAKLGLRWAKPYDVDRWLTLRTGGVWFRARGRPNIVENAGDYYGAFIEFGFEARLSEHWIVGPSLATMVVLDEDNHDMHVVPMITWRILYSF